MNPRHFLQPAGIAAVIMLVAALTSWQFHQTERATAEMQAAGLATAVAEHVEAQILLLDAVRGLMEEQGVVDRPAFERFVRRIAVDGRADGMVGIGYAMMAPVDRPDDAMAIVARNYGVRPAYTPTDQPLRSAIILISPLNESNRNALGFDMYSEARRRAAMDRAWRTGETATSDVVSLVQDRGGAAGPGFLIYQPLYARADRPGVTLPGRRPLQGFVYAPYRAGDLFAEAVGPLVERGSGVSIRAGRDRSAPLVYAAGDRNGPAVRHILRVGDHDFMLTYRDPRLSWYRGAPALILVGGALAALMLGALLQLQRRRAQGLATLAEERAGRARDKDVLLAEMAHRLKNSYARIGALISMTARESDDVRAFAATLRGRVHSLADSVSLLTDAGAGATSLMAVVEVELRRANPGLSFADIADGPHIGLDANESQGLGLTIHELATNSVKYGALGGNGRLTITWAEADGDIALDWTESALDPPPDPAREGFGSQFMQTIVTRQLGGTISRQIAGDVLAIRIVWPRRAPA